jgi:hypothetical protein
MRVKLEFTVVLLALCVAIPSCKKASPGTSAPEQMADDGGSDDPLAQLHVLEGRMQALGLPVGRSEQAPPATGPGDAGAVAGGGDAAGGDAASEDEATLGEQSPTMAPTPSEAKAFTAERDREGQADHCADLCSLSESICTLEVRICDLAQAHDEDPVYADACERAVDDCDVAGRACDGCER